MRGCSFIAMPARRSEHPLNTSLWQEACPHRYYHVSAMPLSPPLSLFVFPLCKTLHCVEMQSPCTTHYRIEVSKVKLSECYAQTLHNVLVLATKRYQQTIDNNILSIALQTPPPHHLQLGTPLMGREHLVAKENK